MAAAGKDWKKVKSAVTINAALGNIVWYNNNQKQSWVEEITRWKWRGFEN